MNYRPIILGTSSFTATGWQGPFYPKGLRPADYLSYYAQHFDSVEIDSNLLRNSEYERGALLECQTPEGFLFCGQENAAKSRTAGTPWIDFFLLAVSHSIQTTYKPPQTARSAENFFLSNFLHPNDLFIA